VATVAWPSMTPVRLSLVVSAVHEPGHFTIAAASALAPAVSTMDAARSPAVPGGRAQLRPFRVQRVPHASLRRSRSAATPRASTAHAHITAKPVHGASG